jgi:hypothetical protein
MSIDPKQKPRKRKLTLAQKIAFQAPTYGAFAPTDHIIPHHARMGLRAHPEKKK